MDRDKWKIQRIEDPHIDKIPYCRKTNKRIQCKLLTFTLIACYFKHENVFSELAMSQIYSMVIIYTLKHNTWQSSKTSYNETL